MRDLAPENLLVEEFTSVDPITVFPGESLIRAKELMARNNIRHLPVVEDGRAIGLISERDIHSLKNNELLHKTVLDFMIEGPYTVSTQDLLKDVVFEMSRRKIGSALVNDEEGNLYGIFTSIDALNSIIELL